MNTMSKMSRWFLTAVALPLALLHLGACGTEPQGEVASAMSALGVNGLPDGLTCGLSYFRGTPWVDEVCEFVRTLDNPMASHPGWVKQYDIDFGAILFPPHVNGFYHQRLMAGDSTPDSRYVVLPQGTACGFKHTKTGDTSKCFGKDPEVDDCPKGWTKRFASDIGASSGANFVWCEYDDAFESCKTFATCMPFVPHGLVCGITDNDRWPGNSCLRNATGVAPNQCPFGFRWSFLTGTELGGFYDAGRSSGHGIGWCTRI